MWRIRLVAQDTALSRRRSGVRIPYALPPFTVDGTGLDTATSSASRPAMRLSEASGSCSGLASPGPTTISSTNNAMRKALACLSRACGVTRRATSPVFALAGLSPPARGNRLDLRPIALLLRSIPARAGQPDHAASRSDTVRVYPRPRGATGHRQLRRHSRPGLSPPARGNLFHRKKNGRSYRSIPARAGQPARTAPRSSRAAVYPRPRGATSSNCAQVIPRCGLSPPARGNPVPRERLDGPDGSIPARAGQPTTPSHRECCPAVYPRPRGATLDPADLAAQRPGLSPPARGNLHGAYPMLGL